MLFPTTGPEAHKMVTVDVLAPVFIVPLPGVTHLLVPSAPVAVYVYIEYPGTVKGPSHLNTVTLTLSQSSSVVVPFFQFILIVPDP